MRVTSNTIYNTVLSNLMKATKDMLDVQEVMTTQKKINHPSDDPAGTARVFSLKSFLSQTNQYQRNISSIDAINKLQDTTLSQVITVLDRAKELALSQANDSTSNVESRQATAIEVATLRQQLVQLANSKDGKDYLFSGYNRSTTPFTDLSATAIPNGGNTGGAIATIKINDPTNVPLHNYAINFTTNTTYDIVDVTSGSTIVSNASYTSGGTTNFYGFQAIITDGATPPAAGDSYNITVTPAGIYNGDGNIFKVEIEQGTYIDINLTGNTVFKGNGVNNGIDIFGIFNTLIDDLTANNPNGINTSLDKFNTALGQIENFQSIVGSRANMLDNVNARLDDLNINLKKLISDTEDIDITKAISDMTQKQTAYQAALGSANQLIKQSLLDFLR